METDLEIDIDMDIDPGPFEYDMSLDDGEAQPRTETPPISSPLPQMNASQLVPTKVYLRGLDNLTSSDVKAFASSYFDPEQLRTIEWINDMSASLVYETPTLALDALAAFTGANIGELSQLLPLQTLPAKPFPEHPKVRLEARLATLGDRKEAGARDRSRFYLFNPQYDPAERRKREGYGRRGGQRYRDRDDTRYRRHEDKQEFDASLYDDDEVSRAVRASKQSSSRESRTSLSSGEYKGQGIRKVRFAGGAARELFPDRLATLHQGGGRLRSRSASPLRGNNSEEDSSDSQWKQPDHRARMAGSYANRIRAQIIKEKMNQTSPKPKELFPQKAAISHKRSDAFDATDATTELFANRMSVPFLDGYSVSTKQPFASRITRPSLESRISSTDDAGQNGFKIRGTAKLPQPGEISIKGIASATENPVKELFPGKLGINSGKELFSEKLEGRGGMRQRAEDMFY